MVLRVTRSRWLSTCLSPDFLAAGQFRHPEAPVVAVSPGRCDLWPECVKLHLSRRYKSCMTAGKVRGTEGGGHQASPFLVMSREWCRPADRDSLVSMNIEYFTFARPDLVPLIVCHSPSDATSTWFCYKRNIWTKNTAWSQREKVNFPERGRAALEWHWSLIGQEVAGAGKWAVTCKASPPPGYSPRRYYSYTCFDYHLDFFLACRITISTQHCTDQYSHIITCTSNWHSSIRIFIVSRLRVAQLVKVMSSESKRIISPRTICYSSLFMDKL